MVFIRGEKPLRASQLSDVKVWNRKHGWMRIIYGVCTVLAWLCGMMIGDSIVACVPFVIGFLGPLVFMVLYHRRLVKRYVIHLDA